MAKKGKKKPKLLTTELEAGKRLSEPDLLTAKPIPMPTLEGQGKLMRMMDTSLSIRQNLTAARIRRMLAAIRYAPALATPPSLRDKEWRIYSCTNWSSA